MVEFELKLAACQRLLSKIDFYEKFICDKGYQRLGTSNYHKKRFTPLRNSIEGDIKQILELLKDEGIDTPGKTFLNGEVIDCLKNETELKDYIATLNQISEEIFKESESSEVDIIKQFDFLPEWLFPTSTASAVSDMMNIQSFPIDNFFNTLMNSERINKTLTFWKEERKKLAKRLPIIEEAIEAHLEGKYYLSVSALISQVEGLLRDALSNPDFDSMYKEDMRRATAALKNQTNASLYPLKLKATSLLDSLPDAVADLYEKYEPEHSIQGKLYRHGVYHGLQTDFGTKKNSLRLILLLDRIIFFYAMT